MVFQVSVAHTRPIINIVVVMDLHTRGDQADDVVFMQHVVQCSCMQQGGTGIKLKFWLISKHDILICGWYFCTKSHTVYVFLNMCMGECSERVYFYKIYITLANTHCVRRVSFPNLGWAIYMLRAEGFCFVVAYTIYGINRWGRTIIITG